MTRSLTCRPTVNYGFTSTATGHESSLILAMVCLLTVEDLERNDGSPEKPYYMNKELKELMGKKNVKADKED